MDLHSAQFSPDGKKIATACWTAAQIWDAQTGKALTQPLPHKGEVNSAQFSPDGKQLATASSDQTAMLWDVQTGRPLHKPLIHAGGVNSAQFSPDGRSIVTASQDGTARVWDVSSGQLIGEPLEHGIWMNWAEFSPDGKRILTTSQDGAAQVWEMQGGPSLSQALKQHGEISWAQFSPDGKRVVTASKDGTAQVWDAYSGLPVTGPLQHGTNVEPQRSWTWQLPLVEALRKYGTNVISAQFSPDGRRIVTASNDHTARVWDAQNGQLLNRLVLDNDWVQPAVFSPDGKRIVTAAYHTARVWDAESGKPLTGPLKHPWMVSPPQFSPDSKRIVTGERNGSTRVWDAQTGQALTDPFPGGYGNVVQFSPEGRRIVTASRDGAARVWDSQTGQPLTEPLKHGGPVNSAQFSPDGSRIVTASEDQTARVWDAYTGLPLTDPLEHSFRVASAQFSPDSERIVTASGDAAWVWDSQTGQPLTEPLRQEGNINFARFSPDGRRIITASDDHTARIWDISPAPRGYPDWLPQVAEAISGKCVNNQGVVEPTKLDRGKIMNQIRQRLNQQPDDGDWIRWGRWLLADRETRTISPFARVTIPEYRERQAERRGLDDWCKAAALGESKGLNAVSWLLATSPAAEVRDGHLAVALAEKVVAATERKNPAMLDTLAAACAEAGQFSRAQSLEREALGLLHDENKKQDYDSRLRLYNSNRPYRNNSTNELTRAAEDRGRRAAFLQTRGALAAQFGLWKEGVRDLTEAVNLNPEDHFTWYQLAPVL